MNHYRNEYCSAEWHKTERLGRRIVWIERVIFAVGIVTACLIPSALGWW